MKIEVDIFRIAEKVPYQDEYVMVKRYCKDYWEPKVYNTRYNCWDDAEGDDYDCDIDENDIWMRLPKNISIEFAIKIK